MDSARPSPQRNVRGIHVDVDACIARRPAAVSCDMCREVCPAGALAWSDDGLAVSAACVACGRCAAACPTGAISADGFDMPVPELALVPVELAIECERVPPQLRRVGARVVPCLGGVTTVQLVRIAALGHAGVLIDRGWCADCPAGRGPAASTLEVVADARCELLAAVGGGEQARGLPLPRTEQSPLSQSWALAPPSLAPNGNPTGGQLLDRRSFFATFRGGARSVVAAASRPRHTRTRAACRPSATIARHLSRRAKALAAAGARVPGGPRASAFPAITVHVNCCHEGVCAAACPSGALRIVEDEAAGEAGLDIDNTLCLACGLCAQLCPHGAISVTPAGLSDAAAPTGPVALTRHALRPCKTCGEAFVARDDTTVCPRCVMAREQAFDLFGARPTGLAHRNTSITPTTHGDAHEPTGHP